MVFPRIPREIDNEPLHVIGRTFRQVLIDVQNGIDELGEADKMFMSMQSDVDKSIKNGETLTAPPLYISVLESGSNIDDYTERLSSRLGLNSTDD